MSQSSRTDAARALKTIMRLRAARKPGAPAPETNTQPNGLGQALDIRGLREGEIHAQHVTIHEGACVRGDIVADTVVIQGYFCGTVRASRVHILDTALVEGELRYDRLAVHPGAQMEANCIPEVMASQPPEKVAV